MAGVESGEARGRTPDLAARATHGKGSDAACARDVRQQEGEHTGARAGLLHEFRSTYGLALTPLWWSAFLIHALSEEADLERALGSEYLDYMKKVRGRIFPGLPF